MSYEDVGTHNCKLQMKSSSGLPPLSPRATHLDRLKRFSKKIVLPCYKHPNTKYHFRSRCTIIAEKFRILRVCRGHIIHPFSPLALCAEFIYFHYFFYEFLGRIFYISFEIEPGNGFDVYLYLVYCIFRLTFAIVFIIYNCNTGYLEAKTIILNKRMIMKRYFKTFLIVDTFPYFHAIYFVVRYATTKETSSNDPVYKYLRSGQLIIMFRLLSFNGYAKTALHIYRIPMRYRNTIAFIIANFIGMHSMACLLHGFPKILDPAGYANITGSYLNNLHVENESKITQYLICLHKISNHFYKGGQGISQRGSNTECLMYITTVLVCAAFHLLIIVYLVDVIKKIGNASHKFAAILYEASALVYARNYTPRIQKRAFAFYQNKYQFKYFNEHAIMNSLSEHLKYEMFLYSCKHLIAQVSIFEGLSKIVIGQLIANMEMQIVLPNDVIVKQGDHSECIYFISHGTAAWYTGDGFECRHFEDGDLLGIAGYFNKEMNRNTIVATETCELFRWNDEDIQLAQVIAPEIFVKINAIIDDRLTMMMDTSAKDEINTNIIIYNLKKGKILEHASKR